MNKSCDAGDRPLNSFSFYTLVWTLYLATMICQTVKKTRYRKSGLQRRKDCQHNHLFIWRPDRKTSKCTHPQHTLAPTRPAAAGKIGRTSLSLVLDISDFQDRVDALYGIYGGVRIRELIVSLKDVPSASLPTSGEQNEFDKTKLDNHFIPMVNPDCARCKLDKGCAKWKENQLLSFTLGYDFRWPKQPRRPW